MLNKRIIIIINGGKNLSLVAKIFLDQLDLLSEYIIIKHYTQKEKGATVFVQKNILDNDIVIAVGGDGTANEVVNGIYTSRKRNLRFGIIPNGTGNDFSKMFLEFNSDQFLERLLTDKNEPINTGYVLSGKQKTYFVNIADIGLGGKVVEIMNRQRKLNIRGKFSYASAIIRGFLSYKKPTLRITSNEFTFNGKVMMLAACNGSTFGHGLIINSDSSLQNKTLNYTLIGDVSLVDYVKNLKKLKKGEKINHPQVYYFESDEVIVNVVSGSLYGETDGEEISINDCTFKSELEIIRVINPLK